MNELVMMDIRSLLQAAFVRLDTAGVDAPKTTARVLLAQALGKPKEWLVAHDDFVPDETAVAAFQALLSRVAAREPMAYVLGHREFYGLDFAVDKRVLIPRPETEMLVERALEEVRSEKSEVRSGDDGGRKTEDGASTVFRLPSSVSAIDIGTGSGAVPVALAKHAPEIRLMATDVSADALAVARGNAARHGVAERITFLQSDLLADVPVEWLRDVRVLTANLPYVTTEEIEGLQPEIQAHEPRVALDGGMDGLDLVRHLLTQVRDLVAMQQAPCLRAAFFEFGATQGAAVLAAAQAILPFARCEILKDLAKLDRVLSVRFDEAANTNQHE